MGGSNPAALTSRMKMAEACTEAKAEVLKNLYTKISPACSL